MNFLRALLLLFCLLGGQGSTLAFFKPMQLPPNRHWLLFEFNGGEARAKLHLEQLRELAGIDKERTDEIWQAINLLPHSSDPLLTIWLLLKVTRIRIEAAEQLDNLIRDIDLPLSQTEQDKIWQERDRRKEIENKAVQVYESIYRTLSINEQLPQLLDVADPDSYKRMVETKSNEIEKSWHDHMRLEQLLHRQAPELANNSHIEWHDIEKLKHKLNQKLALPPSSMSADILTTLDKVGFNHYLSRSTAEKRSKALYYLAIVTELWGADKHEQLKESQRFNQLFSDLMRLRSLNKDDFPLIPALVLGEGS